MNKEKCIYDTWESLIFDESVLQLEGSIQDLRNHHKVCTKYDKEEKDNIMEEAEEVVEDRIEGLVIDPE